MHCCSTQNLLAEPVTVMTYCIGHWIITFIGLLCSHLGGYFARRYHIVFQWKEHTHEGTPFQTVTFILFWWSSHCNLKYKHNISGRPWSNFNTSGTNIHIDSRMNWLHIKTKTPSGNFFKFGTSVHLVDTCATTWLKLIVTVTSCMFCPSVPFLWLWYHILTNSLKNCLKCLHKCTPRIEPV